MKFFLMGVVIILLFSCESDDEIKDFDNEICRQEHFYYTFDEKYYIDSLLSNDYLLIGFEKTYTDEIINEFLDNQIYFNNENTNERLDSNYKLILRKFKTPKKCTAIDEIIEELQTNEIVSFAAHIYYGGFCIGFNCSEIMSYSNEFLVKLNDTSDTNKLNQLVTSTNSWIGKESKLYTLIRVDKNSQGNALQLANYFYETGLFYFTQPNFHYFDID